MIDQDPKVARGARRRSKSLYLVFFTLVFALPQVLYFGFQMFSRGNLTPKNATLLVVLGLAVGFLFAIAMWESWLKKQLR